MAVSRTDRGLDRLVNFTDAAVATAITPLVLPLIDLVTDDEEHSGASLLTEGEIPRLRHQLRRHRELLVGTPPGLRVVARHSRAMLWANFLWLASIVLIPFTTQLLADQGAHDPAVNALYISTMVVTTGSLLLIEWLAVRDPRLQRPRGPRRRSGAGPAADRARARRRRTRRGHVLAVPALPVRPARPARATEPQAEGRGPGLGKRRRRMTRARETRIGPSWSGPCPPRCCDRARGMRSRADGARRAYSTPRRGAPGQQLTGRRSRHGW